MPPLTPRSFTPEEEAQIRKENECVGAHLEAPLIARRWAEDR